MSISQPHRPVSLDVSEALFKQLTQRQIDLSFINRIKIAWCGSVCWTIKLPGRARAPQSQGQLANFFNSALETASVAAQTLKAHRVDTRLVEMINVWGLGGLKWAIAIDHPAFVEILPADPLADTVDLIIPVPPDPLADAPRHSADYRSVCLNGQSHDLTPIQARIIKQLWEAAENGTPALSGEHLLETADSNASRLVDVFRGSLLWGTSIVSGNKKGTYYLKLN